MSTNLRATEANILVPKALKNQMPISEEQKTLITTWRDTITNILNGSDPRLLVIIGPCSIHDPVAVKDYANNLFALQQKCPKLF